MAVRLLANLTRLVWLTGALQTDCRSSAIDAAMTLAAFVAYVLALLLASANPGPAVFGVISTGISRGIRPALAFSLGIALSDVLLVSIVLAGLSFIAQTFGWLFLVMKYAGATYLIILGYRMWRAGSHEQGHTRTAQAGLVSQIALGAAVDLSNPKAMLFHASLMSLILDITRLDMLNMAAVLTAVLIVNILSMGAYAVLSGTYSCWLRTTGAARAIYRVAGSAMIGTGVWIAARN